MIKNIIFDIGNVLLGFDNKRFFERFGYDETMVERLHQATTLSPQWNELDKGVLDYDEVVQLFIKNAPDLEQDIRKIFADLSGMLIRYDYAIDWIKEFKNQGYKVYYLSNFFQKAQLECAETMDFLPYLDGGILSYQEKVTKPDAKIYQLLLKRYNLKAEESVFLDDTEKNVLAARKEGIHGIVFRSKEQASDELRKLGVNI